MELGRDTVQGTTAKIDWERFDVMSHISLERYHYAKRFDTLTIHGTTMKVGCWNQARLAVIEV